ncbi:TonB-linked outer membrane protein, SusC/RagA family [Mariniphaga anaerophila]|uniref:TonB-linked outer membrane protein, SusC/RagA family n=1 Tax=Mariniphaga anaerophila TaxID=1484053 RepID=A0A1M5AM89_9BACT|nr:TonB-dependent receptor [Mariniphaga anaerophila]SHF31254.1 TonB-linked outer membrane protein, SusC/RagA family [Mariniphaga anaerophila]
MNSNKRPFILKNSFIRGLFFSLFFVGAIASYAQVNVKGRVVDETGETLIGVNVLVKGTTYGSITDANGEFTLSAPSSNSTLVFSYVGYLTQEIAMDGRTYLNVTMDQDTEELGEVIVVGYGTQKKVSVTGSVAQINSKELLQAPSGDISSLLAGKLPGLTSLQSSGQPGADGASIRVRGVSTMGKSGVTLIVDGVQRSFSQLDPNDIDKISILKDASAAAVYGVQGAGGVILVTTKRGTLQKPKITYTGKVSYNQNTFFPEFLDGPDFIKWYNKALDMDGKEPLFTESLYQKALNGDPEGKIQNTNWFDEIMKPGSFSTHHNINVNGGNESVKYFLSAGYLAQDGIVDNFDFKRYNVRSNVDVNLNHGFKLELDLAARQEDRRAGYFGVGNQDWNNPITLATKVFPFLPTTYDGLPVVGNFIKTSTYNPVVYNNVGYNNSIHNVLQSSAKVAWELPWVKGLELGVKMSYDKDYTTRRAWASPEKVNSYDIATNTYSEVVTNLSVTNDNVAAFTNAMSQFYRRTLQPSINYQNTFGKHDISGLFLFEEAVQEGEDLGAVAVDYDVTTLHELDMGNDIKDNNGRPNVWGNSSIFRRAGFVGRINYGFDNKYLVELAARYDGSSRFAPKNRWGFFPAASVGWRISEESFFSDLKGTIENLKLRASAGVLGNDLNVGQFAYLNMMRKNPPTIYIGDKEYISVYTAGEVNRDITWEKTTTYNVGFEMMFNRGIFGIEFDYFYKHTRDILISGGSLYPMSLGGNYPGTVNGGEVGNKGFELVLTHNNKIGQFDYYVKGNMGWSRNQILKMNESPNTPEYQKRTGRKLGEKMGFIAEGLYENEEQIMNTPTLSHLQKISQIRPGDIIYKDLNGDGKIEKAQDYTYLGNSSFPELMYGLNLGGSWKNFDASVFFQGAAIRDMFLSGVYGNGHVDATIYTRPFHGNGNSPRFLIEDSWTPENKDAEFARLTTVAAEVGNCNGWASSWWMRNAGYLRLKNAQVGYTINSAYLKGAGIDGVRLSFTGSNLLTWSGLNKYGIDPEAPEISNGYYPQQRTYEFGVSVTF